MAITNMTAFSDGQLPAARATIFYATGAQWIMTINLFNTGGAPIPVNLYLNNGTVRQIYHNAALAAGAHEIIRGPWALLTNDTLQGDDGGTGGTVDYWVSVAGPGS